jgi:hypothetical protein
MRSSVDGSAIPIVPENSLVSQRFTATTGEVSDMP